MNWAEREYEAAVDAERERIRERSARMIRTGMSDGIGIGSVDVETFVDAMNQFRLLNDATRVMTTTNVGLRVTDGEIGALLREATIPARMIRAATDAARNVGEDEFDAAMKNAVAAMRRLRSRTEDTWGPLKKQMEMEDEQFRRGGGKNAWTTTR